MTAMRCRVFRRVAGLHRVDVQRGGCGTIVPHPNRLHSEVGFWRAPEVEVARPFVGLDNCLNVPVGSHVFEKGLGHAVTINDD
jgi:hypothetical protein